MQPESVRSGPLSKPLTDSTLREHFAELRRALVAGVDTQTERITAEVRALLLESLPADSAARRAAGGERLPQPRRAAAHRGGLARRGRGAGASRWLSTALWWRTERLLRSLERRSGAAAAQQRAAMLPAPVAARRSAVAAPGSARRRGRTPSRSWCSVPYGADALGGARLEVIRKLLYRLAAAEAPGVVDIRTFAGRFCLMGNGSRRLLRWRRRRCCFRAAMSSVTPPTRRSRPRSARRWRWPT